MKLVLKTTYLWSLTRPRLYSWFAMDSSRDNLKIIIRVHPGMETTTSVTPIILHITVIQILKFSKGKVQSDNQGEQVSYQNVLQTAEIQSPQWRRIAQIISRWSQHRLTAHGWKSRPGDKCESRGGRGGLSGWNEIAGNHGPAGLGLGLPILRSVACQILSTQQPT